MANRRIFPKHQWTKSEVKKVYGLWDIKTAKEVAADLGVKEAQLTYIVTQMRKAGFDLPKKRKVGYMGNLLKECLLEVDK